MELERIKERVKAVERTLKDHPWMVSSWSIATSSR